MKSFRKIVLEVAEPKAGDEKHFKDKHIVTKVDYPVDVEDQFTGGKTVKKAPKRKADLEAGEDEQVYEAMDPVDKKAALGKFKHRKDKDIDNDGDVDSSDKYLHARRNAVTKAIHKEETENLEEISRDTARSYIRKASAHKTTGETSKKDRSSGVELAGKKAYGIGGKAKVNATEEVEQIDEISKKTLGSYINKAASDVGEIQRDITSSGTKSPDYKNLSRMRKNRKAGITTAVKKLTKEEVEQLAELSPNTLHSYIKKSAGNMAGNAAVAAAQASSSMKKSSPDVKRNIRNRMRGITSASGRLADKANMAEDAWEEVPMMMRQLEYVAYAAEDIMEYLEMDVDPEEWFQNKLAHIHGQIQNLHAYVEGEKRMMSRMDYNMYGEEAELDEKLVGGQKKLDHNKNGKIDAHDFKLMRSKKMKEDLDEAVDYDKMTTAELKAAAQAAIKSGDRNAVKAITAVANKRIANKGGTPVTKLTTDPKKLDALKKQLHGIKKEEAELDEAAPTKKAITRALQGMKVQPKEKVTVKKAPWEKNEEVELDEAAPKIKPDFLKTQREKDRAHDASMGRTPTGRKKTMTSTQRSMASMRKEEVELDESITKMSHGRLKFHMNSGVPHGSYTKDEMKAERDRRLKTDPIGYRSAKAGLNEVTQTAMKKSVTYIDPKGHSRTRDVPVKRIEKDERGQDKIRESVEMLDEAFKAGMVKLKDGGSVVLKKEDADLLNKMFKDLSSTNRKKMQEVAMKDKNGFEEILGFAREAL